jgi:hypothetical protein
VKASASEERKTMHAVRCTAKAISKRGNHDIKY